jgi:hypothetical protein
MGRTVVTIIITALLGGLVGAAITFGVVAMQDDQDAVVTTVTQAAEYEVLAKGLERQGTGILAYVRYNLHGGTQQWGGSTKDTCYLSAQVGNPLPAGCR